MHYPAMIEGAPSDAIADLAERALLTFRLRERGVRNRVSLLQRVKGDEFRLAGLLRSQGYYASGVTSDVTLPPDDAAHVTFLVRPGPAHTIGYRAIPGPGSFPGRVYSQPQDGAGSGLNGTAGNTGCRPWSKAD